MKLVLCGGRPRALFIPENKNMTERKLLQS